MAQKYAHPIRFGGCRRHLIGHIIPRFRRTRPPLRSHTRRTARAPSGAALGYNAHLPSGLDIFTKFINSPGGVLCERILTERIQNVPVEDLQLDEIWSYVQKKEAHKFPFEAHNDKIGDAYTFIALERSSKLVLAWQLGRRDRINTEDFIAKVRRATAPGRFEVCTDGFQPYVNAIADGLSDRADYRESLLETGRGT